MAEQPAYWEAIERYFVKKRGSALILSPKDWPLVHSWQERGIPLEIIYHGIDKAFTRLQEKELTVSRRTMVTLAYCQYDIEEAWKTRPESSSDIPPSSKKRAAKNPIIAECRTLSTKLRSGAKQLRKYAEKPHYNCIRDELLTSAETVESFIPLVAHAEEQLTLADIQRRLQIIEEQLVSQLGHNLDETTRRALYAKAEARLASHKNKMNDFVYRETLHIAFLQELRQVYPLPAL